MSFTFPDPNVTTEFTGDNGITYSWDAVDGKWQIKRYAADFDDRYVNEEGGDTMEGQLIINGPRKAGDNVDKPDLVSSVKVLSIDNAQNSSLQLRHSGNAKVYIGDTDISIASDIKFNRAIGSVVKTNVQDLLNISEQEIAYLGRSIEDEDLITKKYVDDTKEFLQQEIIELEEEIEAIAPSVERGSWEFNISGTVSGPGKFTAYDKPISTAGDATGLVQSIQSIWLHSIDNAGTNHSFSNVEAGNLLELFVDGDPDYGLFEVVEVHDQTGGAGDYWIIDVKFVRTLENTTRFTNGDVCRLKIFQAPEGGTADGFVLKSGDKMTGNLEISGGKGIKFTGLRDSNKAIEMGRNTAEYPVLLALNHPGGSTLGGYDIKMTGNTTYNELRIMGGSNASERSVVVKANGFTTIYKNLNLDNNRIIKLADPTDDTDAATKRYVDDALDFSKYSELS